MQEPGASGLRRRRIGRVLVGAIFVIVGLAGVFKSLDLPVFLDTVETWTLLSAWTRWAVVIGLPPLEMLLTVLWLGGVERARLEMVLAGLLVGFGLTYTAHLTLTEPPKCGCFGLVDEYFKGLSEGRMALWRDCVLLAVLVAGMWVSRTPRRVPEGAAGGEADPSHGRHRHELGQAT